MEVHRVILVVTVFIAQVLGYMIKVPMKSTASPLVTDNTQWVHIQKLMIPLFENVCEDSNNPNICKLAQDFKLDATDYMKPEVVTHLENLKSSGLLPKGRIFSEYNPDHLNEMKIVYEVLYNAKDFDKFYKAAAWARQNLNCALYVNVIYMAIQNRRDTEKLSIPAPYELLPNYFINQEVIIQASNLFRKDYNDYVTESIRSEGDYYIIDANYTGLFYDNDDDSKLAYFREDVGLNSYYFFRKLKMTARFNDDNNESFGENMFQMMKQFMARYNLERYANGLPELDSINWETPLNIPYDPMLIYSNGVEFAPRTLPVQLSDNEDFQQLRIIENNLLDIARHLQQRGYTKAQILNHLMEILVTGDRSYEVLARKLLGKDVTNNGNPSVLEHYMTSVRDPMFWKINMKIVNMIDEALKMLPTYTRNELYFPGVEIVNIEVKKMITAFDFFTFDVTDALKTESTGFRVKVGQPRLNHKQFTIKVNISSLVSQKGIMKIYLGPKVMPGELLAKKNLFTLLDECHINLKVGSNVIARSSDNMKHFSEDFMLLNNIRKNVEYSGFGLNSLPLKTVQSQVGYPSRLILPKGTSQGLLLQMFVFIAPYVQANSEDTYSQNNPKFNSAISSPGYPFDLAIQHNQLFGLPNTMIKYVTVMQKAQSKVENYGGTGVTKSWYSTSTYDLSSRSNYNSKNKQYGNKNDYSVKVDEYNTDTNNVLSDEENFEYDNNIIRLSDTPYSNRGNQFDYSSKRQPFDYKAKKAQYDKKDYSSRTNFIKHDRTTTTSEFVSTTEKIPIVTLDDGNVSNKMDTINNLDTVNIMQLLTEKNTQEDILKVEPLPLPAMLKKDSFDEAENFNYKVKKTERDYKIKGRKVELDQLIKEAKKKPYISYPVAEQVNKDNIETSDSVKISFEGNLEKIDPKSSKIDNKTSTQENFVKDKSLLLPAMLPEDFNKTKKFDYKVKKTERDYKIKAKKVELDKLIKEAKNKQDINNRVADEFNKDVIKTSATTKDSSEEGLEKEESTKFDIKIAETHNPRMVIMKLHEFNESEDPNEIRRDEKILTNSMQNGFMTNVTEEITNNGNNKEKPGTS